MKKPVLRKCLATSKSLPKDELIRVVKTKDGQVFVDYSSKANGRGAYLSKDIDAVKLAQNKHLLDRALETKVDDAIYQELLKIVKEEK